MGNHVYKGANEHDFKRFEVAEFSVNKPNGVVIHYTADDNLNRVIDYLGLNRKGYHLIIERDGTTHQLARFNHKVFHSGNSTWNGFFCNSSFLSVSILSWGILRPDKKSWAEKEVDEKEIRTVGKEHFHAASKEQIGALWSFLEYCKLDLKIPARNVCGHSECCVPAGRKIDPSHVLPFSLNVLRTALTMANRSLLDA